MKLFLRYLSGKHNTFLLFASFVLVFAFAFWLYRLPLAAVLYPAMLCAAVGLIYTFIDYASVKHRHEMLSGFRGIDDELPLPRDIEDADYQEIIRLLREQRREAQTHAESEMQAMVDYYTLWAHEIKTPIAAMRLRLQGQDTAEARGLLTDLSRIERYVEMVLTYDPSEFSEFLGLGEIRSYLPYDLAGLSIYLPDRNCRRTIAPPSQVEGSTYI